MTRTIVWFRGKDLRIADQQYPEPIVDHAEARARYLALATSHLSGS
ncbi:MAG TPA: hypothetical protein VF395_20075 [Polyangiaceae bacterium]